MEREDITWRRGFIPSILHPVAKAKQSPIVFDDYRSVMDKNYLISVGLQKNIRTFGGNGTMYVSSVIVNGSVPIYRCYYLMSEVTLTIMALTLNDLNVTSGRGHEPFVLNQDMNQKLIEIRN